MYTSSHPFHTLRAATVPRQARSVEDGTQQALVTFTQLAHKLGAGAATIKGHALGLLHGLVRREALVHALNDGFYAIMLVALVSTAIILTMRTVRRR